MNDYEIIETLEACSAGLATRFGGCTPQIATETLKLLNRQLAEIERLKAEVKELTTAIETGTESAMAVKLYADKIDKEMWRKCQKYSSWGKIDYVRAYEDIHFILISEKNKVWNVVVEAKR